LRSLKIITKIWYNQYGGKKWKRKFY
jgi:hypothetical protein